MNEKAKPAVIRVQLPGHLRQLARCEREVTVEVEPTLRAVLGALEAAYPPLRGTIRDQNSGKRRAFVRFFACDRDLSHDPIDDPLPDQVINGSEPLLVIGAMAGG